MKRQTYGFVVFIYIATQFYDVLSSGWRQCLNLKARLLDFLWIICSFKTSWPTDFIWNVTCVQAKQPLRERGPALWNVLRHLDFMVCLCKLMFLVLSHLTCSRLYWDPMLPPARNQLFWPVVLPSKYSDYHKKKISRQTGSQNLSFATPNFTFL